MNNNRIANAFLGKKAFIGFVTGGDPSIEKSEEFILELVRGGTDLVEIGVPFSDPVAEGPTIAAANARALEAGTTLEGLFGLVESLRRKTDVPIVFLTYLNPVFRYGYERFFARCAKSGVDGAILPDLPFEEKEEAERYARPHHVDVISLVAPTSKERVQKIAAEAAGFLYVVSSMGVTGARGAIETDLKELMRLVRAASKIPAAIGFGVHTPEQAREIAKIADGVIVGSGIVEIIARLGENAGPELCRYAKAMKEAMA
ncbi:MAG: tryptophan synthase subunit alpha [Bacillota bacterium]